MTLTPPDPNPLDPDEPGNLTDDGLTDDGLTDDGLTDDGLTDDDLAVDAVADGVATAAQRARVEASASLRERVAVLASLRARLASPVEPLPPDMADEIRRVALDASLPDQRDNPGEDRPTVELPAGRSTNRTPWLVAAAIVLLLALGAVTLPRLTTDRSDTATSSAASGTSTTVESLAGGNDATPSAPEAAASAESVARSQSGVELFANSLLVSFGDVPTVAELVERAVAELDPPGGAANGPRPESLRPDESVRACLTTVVPDASAELVARGTIDAVEHLVIVTARAGGGPQTRSVEVVRLPDCAVVDRSLR